MHPCGSANPVGVGGDEAVAIAVGAVVADDEGGAGAQPKTVSSKSTTRARFIHLTPCPRHRET
jgi:hypothetical protein